MAIKKVTEVFALILLPSGNVRPYYAIVKSFDPNAVVPGFPSQVGSAELQFSRINTNSVPQFENVSYSDIPPVRIGSYPCGLPHIGPKLNNVQGIGTISSNGTAITGVGTNFLSQLSQQDSIDASGNGSTVQSVVDNEHMVIDPAPANDYSNVSFTFNKNDSMNCIYMPSGDMNTWMMGVWKSFDPTTGLHTGSFPDGNGGTQDILFAEMQPAAGTAPSMFIPLNIGYTEDAVKTWFADPANSGPI